MGDALGLYLHLPFCRARCFYCDFNTYAGCESILAPYVQAVGREMELVRQSLSFGRSQPVSSIYLGGGTPSLLPTESLGDLLGACQRLFSIDGEAEISLEANPGTVSAPQLARLRRLGFNRLSLGLQSARPDELALLGRRHTFTQAAEAVGLARQAGFDNLNLDLIYGIPGQTLADWRTSLQAALALDPNHLSAYCLTLHQGTPLADQVAEGRLPAPDPDLAADMYQLAEALLAQAGWQHYEISNWAKPGYACRHNLVYWRNQDYLGFGAGAHSHLGGRRWSNLSDPDDYLRQVERGQWPTATQEVLSDAQVMGETMMLGLRLVEGVSGAEFVRRFGRSIEGVYGSLLVELEQVGLVESKAGRVRLTDRGRLLGNQVFQRFV